MIRSMGPGTNPPQMIMMDVTLSPEEQAKDRDRDARFRKNMAWYEAHVREIREQHAGKSICVAGETVFAGDDPAEVIAQARAAYPHDWGAFFTIYLRPKR